MFKKILLCLDQSEHSKRNIELACTLVKKLQAELTILQVVVIPSMGPPGTILTPQKFVDKGEEFLSNVKQSVEEQGVKAITHLETTSGSVSNVILKYAKKEGFDLITLGATGTSEVDIHLGGVAFTVSRHALCPVLILR